jgi:hypothetical protein
MALGTYEELKASLAGWLHRSDVNGAAVGVGVDNVVEDWIQLFEAEINTDLRLRVMETDVALTTTVGSRAVALPARFIEPVGLWLEQSAGTEPVMLRFLPVTQLPRATANGIPQYWSIDGEEIIFDCPADAAYAVTFRMMQGFALSDAAPTNWLLTNYPNLYLYGALMHSPMYLMQDARASGWAAMHDRAKAKLDAKEHRTATLATLSVDPALLASRSTSTFDINRG